MKSMIFSCKFLRVCALPVPAEGDSSAGRALSPASVRSEPACSTDDDDDDDDHLKPHPGAAPRAVGLRSPPRRVV